MASKKAVSEKKSRAGATTRANKAFTVQPYSASQLAAELGTSPLILKKKLAGLATVATPAGRPAGSYYLLKDVVAHLIAGSGRPDEKTERALMVRAKRQEFEREVAKRHGLTLTVEQAAKIYSGRVNAFKQGVIALGPRIDAYRETIPPKEFREKVDGALRSTLELLSE